MNRPARTAATHPVVPGYHPDPSVCRVGEEYFLATSSFEYAPGVPIHRSTDLVHWELLGHALTREDQWPLGTFADSRGIFAPTLRHHDGRFWMITTDVDGLGGQLLVTAQDPAGPWSPAVRLPHVAGIDPDIAWDDDGRCLVTFCATLEPRIHIMQVEVDPATGETLEEPRSMWSGTGLEHPEAPHLYRRDGWWYLMVAEGGTGRGHAVSIARSRSPRGPFEGAAHNPILSHRSLGHPVQSTGHADLVERPDGTWAILFLGTRPRGSFPGWHVNGRESFLAEVKWRDGWPHAVDSEVSVAAPGWFEDELAAPLGPRWVSPGLLPEDFVSPAPGGGVELRPADAPSGAAAMIAARCTEEHWRATAEVEPGTGTAALRVRLDERHWVEVRAGAGGLSGVVRVGDLEQTLTSLAFDGTAARLEVRSVPPTTGGPDDLELAAHVGGRELSLGRLDGRYLSSEVAGGFTGRMWGARAVEGTVTVRRLAVGPLEGA
ncbi:MAG: glycoside hydrolase family 43 protein [Actinomycetales bacterium]|nr:glycoside hydrolase family 43 protein [Actinomycetales bacterium]